MDISLAVHNDESQLIASCIKGERWAQKQLYESHYNSMMHVCLRYAKSENEALDLLHDGFMKVFANIAKYKPGTSLHAWMRRLMVNTCIDQYRKDVRRRTESLEQTFEFNSCEADAISRCSEKEIMEAVQGLSNTYRLVFNMYVIEGYTHREIADLLGITESTSRSNLVKARNKLKMELLHLRKDEY